MSILIDEAEALLAPYLPTIWDVISAAWMDYQTKYSDVSRIHSARSRSSLIHDHMVYHANILFEQFGNDVVPKKVRGMFYLLIEGKLALRFKKLNSRMLASNIRTRQVSLFDWQTPFLPGTYVELTHANAGYIVNLTGTGPAEMLVACPKGNRKIDWFIPRQDGSDILEVFESRVMPIDEMPTRKRVRPRKKEEDKKEAQNNGGEC